MRKIESTPDNFILAALGAVTFVVLYFTKAAELSGMSIGFVKHVANGDFVFHPHHLLFQSVLSFLYRVFGSANCDALCVSQLHSIFWGMVTVLSAYVISRHVLPSKLNAILTSLSLMAIHGFAIYSTQIEPYVPILGMSSLLAAILVKRGPRNLGWKNEVLFVSVMSMSLLFHQAMLFFFLPIAYWLIANNGWKGLASVIRMIAFTGVIVLATFMAAYWSTYPENDVIDFVHWIMYYQTIGDPTNLQGTFQGLLDLRLRQFVYSVQKLVVAIDGAQVPTSIAFSIRVLVGIFVGTLVLWNVFRILGSKGKDRIRTLMFIWAGVFSVFFFWWSAGVYKFFIIVLAPVVILTAMSINDLAQRWRHNALSQHLITGATLVTLILIAGMNLTVSVLPVSRSPGAIHELASKLAKAGPTECNFYSMRFLSGYVSHYFGRNVRPFNLMFRKHYYSTRNPVVAETIGVDFDIEDERCAVIPLYWVSREYFVDRSRQGIGAYLSADDWPLFVAWFFEAKVGEAGPEVSFSSFDVVQDVDGDRYLIVDRTSRQSAASVDELLERLDNLYALRPSGSFDMNNRTDIDRTRRRSFGYN